MTILSAWLFIHLSFAFHYAHEYFDEVPDAPANRGRRAGADFSRHG
jgi:uncharacterized membrane protein